MLGEPAGVRLLVCTLVCVVGACAGPRASGTPAPIELVISAERQLNPDEEGHSLPTTLRIYQLKGAEKLEAAEFDQLYRNEKETLGETLLRVDEIALSPGGSLRKLLPRDPAAHALAAVAIFRRPSGTGWRAIEPLPESGAPRVAFTVENYRIERGETRSST